MYDHVFSSLTCASGLWRRLVLRAGLDLEKW